MASRYLKIPVYQVISERDQNGNVDSSYSKILKTLRVPQEMLVTTTGSPYVEGADFGGLNVLVEDRVKSLEEVINTGNFLQNYPISTDNLDNGTGMWIQIPMKTNKYPYNPQNNVSGTVRQYNSSLWLRVSQEVQFENVSNGKSCVIYTLPFISNLLKQSNSDYIIPTKEDVASVGNKDFHGVYSLLQQKVITALSSNPGARETLLDFGSTDGDVSAGAWEITWAGDQTGSVPLTPELVTQTVPSGADVIHMKQSYAEIINKKSRLIVTCAAVSNLGQVTEGLNSQRMVYPTLNETWNIHKDIYDSYSGGGGLRSDQTAGLNNDIFVGANAGNIFNPDDEVGDIGSTNLQRMCEFWSIDPAKGGGKFPEGPIEELPEGIEEALEGAS